MTTRGSSHCFSASNEATGQGLAALGLRLRLTRELSPGSMVLNRGTGGQLLLLSPVIV
jgi:hypothetical protein